MTPTNFSVAARRAIVGLTAVSLCATGLAVGAAAVAAPAKTKPAPRDPISSTVKVLPSATGLVMSGWAVDPDSPATNLTVRAVLDGVKTLATTATSLPNAKVSKRYAAGPTPAYSLDVPVPAGKHVVCAVLNNIGGGLSVVKKCVTTPLGRKLTAAQSAKRSPKGAIESATASATAVRLTGWASDPDFVAQQRKINVYVNGRAAPARITTAYQGTLPVGAGKNSRFEISLPASATTQIACVWVPNVGFGKKTFLGCRTLDPRGVNTSAVPPTTPIANTALLALAKQQIGKRYVWAAAGPKSFDCSGLVMWSYRKNGVVTPRVAADQRRAARVVPLARAVPGDLVFYNDNTGHVYHVGIFIAPGLSVAAIDTKHGVNFQRIYAAAASYGSFTHT